MTPATGLRGDGSAIVAAPFLIKPSCCPTYYPSVPKIGRLIPEEFVRVVVATSHGFIATFGKTIPVKSDVCSPGYGCGPNWPSVIKKTAIGHAQRPEHAFFGDKQAKSFDKKIGIPAGSAAELQRKKWEAWPKEQQEARITTPAEVGLDPLKQGLHYKALQGRTLRQTPWLRV